MVRISGWIENALGMSPDLQGKLLITLLALMLVALIRYLILRLAFRKSEDVRLRYRLRKTSTYISYAIAAMILGWIWFEGFYALSTYLGLVSAALTIALQTPIVNLAGWPLSYGEGRSRWGTESKSVPTGETSSISASSCLP